MINPDRLNVCRSSLPGLRLRCLCEGCLLVGASSLFRLVETAIFVQCMVRASVTHEGPALCVLCPVSEARCVSFFSTVRTTYRDVSWMMGDAFSVPPDGSLPKSRRGKSSVPHKNPARPGAVLRNRGRRSGRGVLR